MCYFWRICLCVYDSKISDSEGTVLVANLDKLITGEIHWQVDEVHVAGDENFRNTSGKDGVGVWTR
jgi:hypothetical protein